LIADVEEQNVWIRDTAPLLLLEEKEMEDEAVHFK
jgi:agmatine/peptidylarginine deiminase